MEGFFQVQVIELTIFELAATLKYADSYGLTTFNG
jgi:hypothetical protein